MRERMTRSRAPQTPAPSDDRSARKQEPAASDPRVAKHSSRPGGQHDRGVAVGLVRVGPGGMTGAIVRSPPARRLRRGISSAGVSAFGTRGRLSGPLESCQRAPPVVNVRRAFAADRKTHPEAISQEPVGPQQPGTRLAIWARSVLAGRGSRGDPGTDQFAGPLGRSSSNPPYGGSPESLFVRPPSPGHFSIGPFRGR
jgi:hypothetical protein